MNCFKFMFLCISCWVLLTGCKGTGILMMPSKEDPVNVKYKCSNAFLNGYWVGAYEKSKLEIKVKPGKQEKSPCRADIWIYDKNKKQLIIPMILIPLQVKEDKYVLLLADIGEMMKKGDYSPVSNGFLYPVMKIFKVSQPEPGKLSYQEVIFTKKEGKDKIVKLDTSMKMWGDNSNMLYGTSSEIFSYLEDGKYQLSEKSTVTKQNEAPEKAVKKE